MSNTFQTARANLATQIKHDTQFSTYSYPQPVPQALSVQITPDDPYIVSTNQKAALTAKLRLRIEMFTPVWDNQGNLAQLEEIAQTVRTSILDYAQNCGDLSAPRIISLETGDLLTAYFPVELMCEWSS